MSGSAPPGGTPDGPDASEDAVVSPDTAAAPAPEPAGDAWDEAAADLLENEPPAEAEVIGPEATVESLVVALEQVTAERDDLAQSKMRLQADFENTKKQMLKRQADQAERANESLVGELLEVLDAMESARAHTAEAIDPLLSKLLEVLGKAGLTVIPAADESFDPTLHEAVMHEEGPGGDDGMTVVVDVLRTGYAWKGRTLRPAMVKVRG